MKRFKVSPNLILVGMLILGSSCASNQSTRLNRIEEGFLIIETADTENVAIYNIGIYQNGSDLEIEGRISKRNVGGLRIKGHIQLAIVDPTGLVIKERCYNLNRGFAGPRRKTFRTRLFNIKIDSVPVQDSKIRLSYHGNTLTDEELIHCDFEHN